MQVSRESLCTYMDKLGNLKERNVLKEAHDNQLHDVIVRRVSALFTNE
jgi:hypothetical protein